VPRPCGGVATLPKRIFLFVGAEGWGVAGPRKGRLYAPTYGPLCRGTQHAKQHTQTHTHTHNTAHIMNPKRTFLKSQPRRTFPPHFFLPRMDTTSTFAVCVVVFTHVLLLVIRVSNHHTTLPKTFAHTTYTAAQQGKKRVNCAGQNEKTPLDCGDNNALNDYCTTSGSRMSLLSPSSQQLFSSSADPPTVLLLAVLPRRRRRWQRLLTSPSPPPPPLSAVSPSPCLSPARTV